MKKLFVITITIFVLASCGSKSQPSLSASSPSSMVGTWKGVSDNTGVQGFTIVVTDNKIQINWLLDNSSPLYWVGTFPQNGSSFVSVGDTEAMTTELLASQDTTKTFTWVNGKLTFPVTALGVTKMIHFER